MNADIRVDITKSALETKIQPSMTYSPAALQLKGKNGTIEIEVDDDQLAEIGATIQAYLNGIRYSETPDQQAILNHEITQSIEEGVA